MFGQVAACRAMLVLCVRKVGAARSEFYAKVWEGYYTICACHGQRGRRRRAELQYWQVLENCMRKKGMLKLLSNLTPRTPSLRNLC